ncbi:MAG: acyl transferase [Ferruginibacter sp.]
MFQPSPDIKDTFNILNAASKAVVLDVFLFQFQNNPVYRQYCTLLNRLPENVKEITDIPFLPIRFFKSQQVSSTAFVPELVFESSGTSGSINSRHFIKSKTVYEESFLRTFEQFYGNPSQYCILGLLPSYLERGNSSLVYMVQKLIDISGHPASGFYLHDFEKLKETLIRNEAQQQKTILIGVTYALIDFAAANKLNLEHTIVMETGGMKGRRKEMTRGEVHDVLKTALDLGEVHSEYGMTELLSQAYAKKDGIFETPPWMQVLLRAEDDPFELTANNSIKNIATGAVNIIDLANLYSCAFIATDDVGKLYPNGNFEVLGRLDNSDIRGCSLLSI